MIKTALHENSRIAMLFYNAGSFFMKSIAQGAATQVFCAVRSDLVGGAFYADCQVAWWVRGDTRDPALGEALWTRSLEICEQARSAQRSNTPDG